MNRWCFRVFCHKAKRPAALLFVMAAVLALGALPAAGQTNIVADPSAPANQRPTVLAAPNGVPAVNIQTPSSAGVSRNTYTQFDVAQQGAILNNARTNTQTQLGGWVQGNPWLATGSARVILNEVNSSNPSLLGGYVEVAGQRAEVVIANPAGINVDGGGFINASRATLTTGTPLFNGGFLEGYEVRDGHIGIGGAGLDATRTDYTDLIARSVEVNAGIWANQLKVTTGANRVDATHTMATPIAATGKMPALAIDTSQLGGMYAGKITLIGTEAGVGVRNAGTIGASAGEVVITAEGRLENSGRIAGAGSARIDSTAGIANSGTIFTQASAALSTRGDLGNSGVIAAQGDARLTATGADSSITSTGGSVLAAGVQADGSLGTGGALTVAASQTIAARGRNLAGGEQTMSARSLDLSGSQTTARTLNLSAGAFDLDLTGADVAVGQTLTANARHTLRTDGATLSAGSIAASAYDLSNVDGNILQIGGGELNLILGGSLDNTGGLISAERTATVNDPAAVKSLAIANTGGTLAAGQRLEIDGARLDGTGYLLSGGDLGVKLSQNFLNTGQVYAAGTANLEIDGTLVNQATMQAGHALRLKAAAIDNGSTGTIAANRLDLAATGSQGFTNRGLIDGLETFIEASTFANLGTGRVYGDHFALAATALHNVAENGAAPVIAARDRLDLGVAVLDNREHALLFSAGDLAIGGRLDAHHCAVGRATTLDNASATIEALGNLTIGADQLTNGNLHFGTTTATVSETPFHQYWGHEFGVTPLYDAGTPGVYVYAGHENIQVLRTPAGNHRYWSENQFTRTVTETRIASSEPAQILAGGAIDLSVGTLLNDKSHIVAGGALGGSIGSLRNVEVAGERVIADLGTSTLHAYVHRQNKSDYTKTATTVYAPPPSIEAFTLTPTIFRQQTAPAGTGTRIDEFAVATNSDGPTTVVRSVAMDTRLPTGSLFVVHTSPTSHYLIETDARFANYRQWLSSDYLLHSLELDPALTQKRLGDGFYEQRLIREQVAQLTGRRFLEGYADDEAQYQALMNNGATFARSHNLRPGVALSAEQVAALTSDIVWLVEETVTLADGSTAQVLVPKVYVRVQDGDLQASGALIAGDSVGLDVAKELVNSGTIAGRTVVALTAENVRNLGGRVLGSDVGVQARGDLDNFGGTISAGNNLIATAGRDLNLVSTTHSQANDNGRRTNIERVAGLYVTGGNGSLIASSGRDLNLLAAAVDNGGSGATVLAAGVDLNVGTVEESASNRIVWDRANHRSDASRTDVGTMVHTKGDLRLQAGLDLNLKAADIATETGGLLATAGRDINLLIGDAYTFYDEAHRYVSKGMFSTKTTTTRDTVAQTSALGTTLSGETATVFAGRDINVLGGNIVSTAGTDLVAEHDIHILAATDFLNEYHFKKERKSGLLGTGAVGFTIGSETHSIDQTTGRTLAAASTIGSTEGTVDIWAGRNYSQKGSNLLAATGDIDITARQVDILEAREATKTTTIDKYSRSGLTIAAHDGMFEGIESILAVSKAMKNTDNDRAKALGWGSIAMSLSEFGQGSVKASVGKSTSTSTTTEYSDDSAGSLVAAGGNVSITAAGAGGMSDLNVRGSAISAGKNILLDAEDALNLLATKNTGRLQDDDKSNSFGVGVSYGTSLWRGHIDIAGGGGSANGDDISWTNTHVTAGDGLFLLSGADTTLRGAVVSGQRVVADVGGDLTIESLQDASDYSSKQRNYSANIAIGRSSSSATLGYGKSSIRSDYVSVGEQSGIKAGDDGFAVHVAGNTELKGAVIAATDKAVEGGYNHFTTGNLALSDIANKAAYEGDAVALSITVSRGKDDKGVTRTNVSGGGMGVAEESGQAASTTSSGISGIAGNTAVRTGDAETGIKPIFDADKVQKELDAQVLISRKFNEQAVKAAASYVRDKVATLKKLAEAETDPDKKAELTAEAAKWAPNGSYNIAMNIIISAAGGGSTGAISSIAKESLSWAANEMRQAMIEDSRRFPGLCTSAGDCISNASGKSDGVNGDGFKLAGGRIVLDKWCADGRCTPDPTTKSGYAENPDGTVKFNPGRDAYGNQLNITQFLEQHPDWISPMGGHQGGQGYMSLLGLSFSYNNKSVFDKIAESYAGTHDTFNSFIWYDELGNGKILDDTPIGLIGKVTNWTNVGAATPFALSTLLPPEVWNAIIFGMQSIR